MMMPHHLSCRLPANQKLFLSGGSSTRHRTLLIEPWHEETQRKKDAIADRCTVRRGGVSPGELGAGLLEPQSCEGGTATSAKQPSSPAKLAGQAERRTPRNRLQRRRPGRRRHVPPPKCWAVRRRPRQTGDTIPVRAIAHVHGSSIVRTSSM